MNVFKMKSYLCELVGDIDHWFSKACPDVAQYTNKKFDTVLTNDRVTLSEMLKPGDRDG